MLEVAAVLRRPNAPIATTKDASDAGHRLACWLVAHVGRVGDCRRLLRESQDPREVEAILVGLTSIDLAEADVEAVADDVRDACLRTDDPLVQLAAVEGLFRLGRVEAMLDCSEPLLQEGASGVVGMRLVAHLGMVLCRYPEAEPRLARLLVTYLESDGIGLAEFCRSVGYLGDIDAAALRALRPNARIMGNPIAREYLSRELEALGAGR